jgi:hypothetical protein
MPVATLEQSTAERSPVFVANGRRRNHGVRVAAATLGILLAGWLAALAAGLIGFAPLPKLAVPGTSPAKSAPVPPEPASSGQTAMHRDPAARGLSTVVPSARGGDERSAAQSAPASSGAGSGASGTASQATARAGGAETTPSQPTPPGAGTPAQPSSGHPPPFTPPASGDKSATPPRGKSANAPGRTVSADPPGKATRPHSR